MQNLSVDGVAKIEGGEYGTITIDGMATASGDISAESVSVDGMFKCAGSLTARLVSCDGMAKIRGNAKAGKMTVNGMLTVTDGNKIEADEIECDGMVKVDGEISADRIRANGLIDAAEITGDDILIRSHRHFCGRSSSVRINPASGSSRRRRSTFAGSSPNR